MFPYKALLVLPIMFVIFVSGCTNPIGPGNVQSGGGITVEFFGPDIQVSEIFSEEPINFQIKFRNTGSVRAEHVFAELFGLDESWCCGTTGVPNEGSWTTNNEKLPNEDGCRYTGSGTTLLPPDQQMGTQGESRVCTWSYRAPTIPRNIPSVPYTPTVRVFYDYKTILVKSITFGSHQDIRGIQDVGGTLPVSTTSSTSSPVSLSMETKSPIRFWTSGSGGEVTFPVDIGISNIGGGMACSAGFGTEKPCKLQSGGEGSKNRIMLKITPDEGLELHDECSEFLNGKLMTLFKGQSNSISCDVSARGLRTTGPVKKAITLEAFYEYVIDTETSISVIGMN